MYIIRILLFWLVLIIVSGFPSQAQVIDSVHTVKTAKGYTIRGKVKDQVSKYEIPGAVVYLMHSSAGGTTDADGNFNFHTDILASDSIQIQAMGYKNQYYVLNKKTHEYNLSINLERSAKMLNEVTIGVKAEDPALWLMRHVIMHKPYNNPDKADNYSYRTYNRLEADLMNVTREQFQKIPFLKNYSFIYNDLDTVTEAKPFLPMYMTETISDFYFRHHPKKQREFIKGSMVKGINNESITRYLGTLYQNVNVYKNYIPVFDKKFISPINDKGPFYYKYTIIDTEQAYGHDVYYLKFTPRRPGENTFTGYMRIIDGNFALISIDMNVPSLANLNWVEKVNISQDFEPVDTFWFVSKDNFTAHFTMYNSKKLPAFVGRKTTTFHNIKVNDTLADSVLEDSRWKEDVIKNDSAKKRNEDWWLNNRPDTLTKNEIAINKNVDSINNMPITRIYKKVVTVFVSGVYDLGPVELGPYFYTYSSNSVEGNRFRLSLATPHTLKEVHVTGFLAYGTLDKRYKYGSTAVWILQRNPRVYLYGYMVHDVESTLSYYDQIGNDNIFNAFLRKPGIPWKLAFTDEQHLEIYKQFYSGLSIRPWIQHQQYNPYQPLPSAGIFQDVNGHATNVINNTSVNAEIRWAYKEKYVDGYYFRRNFGSKYPVLDLTLTNGFKGLLNSAYNYQKAIFSISESINVPPFGRVNYNVFTGKYFGTLPYPLLQMLPGNEYHYYNSSAFEMMNNYEFLADKYAGFFFEHNFGSGLFHYLPILKFAKLRQFWTAKGVIGSVSNENEALNFNKGYEFRTLQGQPYLELGTGISNILEFARIDFVWRVTPKPLADESRSKYFGIFVSAYFQF